MSANRPRPSSGFTLIELLIVMSVVGILAGLALPNMIGAVDKADAVRVVSDMRTVRLAAMELLNSSGVLPSAGGWGEIPSELAEYLPEGFAFEYKDVEYAWSILGVGAPGSAAAVEWVDFVYAYTAVDPEDSQGGQGKGKGKGGGTTTPGPPTGGGTGGSGESGGGSATGSVGVFWVRYSTESRIGGALQSQGGNSAFWTPTQMMFVVTG